MHFENACTLNWSIASYTCYFVTARLAAASCAGCARLFLKYNNTKICSQDKQELKILQ
jgi:hypothetical protein